MGAVPNPPIPYTRLQEITTQTCEEVLRDVTGYDHPRTQGWNSEIISQMLQTIIKETTPSSGDKDAPTFKFVVNSTIIQHAPGVTSDTTNNGSSGRRGMHSASGAYWNGETDGMWSYKYDAAEKHGMDVVIGVFWIWVDTK